MSAFFSHISDVAGPGPPATVFERVDRAFVKRGKLSEEVTTEVGAGHLTKESGAAFEAELQALRSRLMVVWPEVQRYAVGGFDKDAGGGPIENAKNVTDELEAVEAGLDGVAVRIREAVAATGTGGGEGAGPGGPAPSGPQDSGGGVPAAAPAR